MDFNADWYDDILNSHKAAAVILTMIALTIGIVLSFTIMSQNRKRFEAMLKSLSELDHQTEKLDKLIIQSSIKKLELLPESESTVLKTLASGEAQNTQNVYEYDALSSSIEKVYSKLNSYLKHIDSEVYTDDMTGVKNKAAYRNKIKELDELITAGTAAFSAAFFDINGLKKIYTNYGFEAGEKLMFECAKILKNIFGKNNVYHITGDEFIVLIENKSRFDMEDLFKKFDSELKAYNNENVQQNNLSVAKGTVTFDPEKHKNYRQLFIETEAACFRDKDAYYNRPSSTY